MKHEQIHPVSDEALGALRVLMVYEQHTAYCTRCCGLQARARLCGEGEYLRNALDRMASEALARQSDQSSV
jgi:hypothetical protein